MHRLGYYLYGKINVGEGSFLGDKFNLTKAWDIFNDENSPLKDTIHIENGKVVTLCTYKSYLALEEGFYRGDNGNEQMETSIIKDNSQQFHLSISYDNYDNGESERARFIWSQLKQEFVLEEAADDSLYISVQWEEDGLFVELLSGSKFVLMKLEKTEWLDLTNVVLAVCNKKNDKKELKRLFFCVLKN